MSASHSHGGSAATAHQGRLALVFGLTSVYLVVQVVGGLVSGSLALLADAGHMLTDAFGLAMALVAIHFAQKAATPRRTYGFYRTEVLAALANALLLLGIAAWTLFEAWRRLSEPHPVESVPMLLVASGGLVINLVGLRLLREGAKESLNLEGAMLEVLGDLFGSIATILAALVIFLTGWSVADPLISVVIGFFILPRAWRLLRGALDVLLEATPPGLDMGGLRLAMEEVPGVVSVHDLHVWTITSGFVAMSGHVQAQGRGSSDVLHDLRQMLHDRFGIEHTTLQVEQCDHPDEDSACCQVDARCLVVGDHPAVLAGQAR